MQYFLILIAFLYGLVTPTTVYESQAAAGAFSLKKHLFWKGVFWSPQAMFTAEQAAAGAFFQKNDMPL